MMMYDKNIIIYWMTHDKEDDNDDDNDDDACAHDIWYEADLTWHITIASTHNFYFSLNIYDYFLLVTLYLLMMM